MAGEGREEEREQESGRARFEGLVMNEVPSSITQEPSEVRRRAGGLWLLLVAIAAIVGGLGYGARTFLNMAPGQEAQRRLEARVSSLPAYRQGIVLSAVYTAGDRLRVDFATALRGDAASLRKATIEVMKAFMEERPNRDLYIDGYQGTTQVVKAQYRAKGRLEVAGGEPQPEITVKVAGEPEGGITELVKPRGRTAPGQ
jgi:hypothetical protein